MKDISKKQKNYKGFKLFVIILNIIGIGIVYFYKDRYYIGEYCKSIEGFMTGFADSDPIIDENDIPKFVSNDDLLNRYLNDITDIDGVAIYNVNGTCINFKKRN